MEHPASLPEVDGSRPHPARVYNYWLGGKDNFAVDRELADAMRAELPGLPMIAKAHRRFQERTVRHSADTGLRQFLIIGCGLPTTYNLHEVAQEVDPTARVVYADADPVVAAHSRALLVGDPKGAVAFVLGDTGDPATLLADPELTGTVDLDAPVAVTLSTTLAFHSDERAREILDVLLARMAPGSQLSLCNPTAEFDPHTIARVTEVGRDARVSVTHTRTRVQVEALFAGLEPVPPGVVPIVDWRPDGAGPQPEAHSVHILGGMGRKR